MNDFDLIINEGGIERLKARLRIRRAQLLAWGALLCLSAFAASVIWFSYQQAVTEFGVPDLAVCSLRDVDCGRWEPVQMAERGIIGQASWYDYQLASGWSSVGHKVCASRDFPKYTYLLVTELEHYYQTVCYVTDYGPDDSVHPDRIIDLSSTAFVELAPIELGTIMVRVQKYDAD